MIINNQEIKDFGSLELLARQVVEGFLIGLHKSPFHGFSVEFAEHRIYNPGESTKNIDWKVYARTDKLFTKKFEEETNLRCRIVMDISSSMYFPKDKKENKLRFASLAAAALMNLMSKQRDAFGMTSFDSSVKYHGPAKSKSSHFHMLLSKLESYLEQEELKRSTSTVKVLHEIADSIPRRSLVIIFSDMLEDPENLQPMLSALQHLKHNKHEVILFHVVDEEKELNFNFENRPYQFVDMETGEQVKLRSNQVREFYKEKMNAFQKEVYLKCLQYKIDYIKADINKGFKQILQSYLVKRSKMRV